jgi:hypothetical protein
LADFVNDAIANSLCDIGPAVLNEVLVGESPCL